MKLPVRRVALVCALASALWAAPAQAADPVLDLETLDGLTAEKMMEDGTLTAVQLTRAYIARIAALNKRGPGINAVTQLNPHALEDAALLDKERAMGHLRGPAHGLPILLKDLIDVQGMYTSAGNYSLRNSFPPTDSGIAKKLREHGVIILGKLGLSEFANSFGNQHSGFSNLTGQVLNGLDTDAGPSGSSSGTGAAGAAALSMLTVGTETSGSIISPSNANGLVGLRPTVGLVPGYGIAPISASQDTAGPMERSVANAALNLQSTAGADPDSVAEYTAIFGPNIDAVLPPAPATVPNYMSALDLNFVRGKRIGYNGTLTDGSPLKLAYDALVAAGAIMVSRPTIAVGTLPALPSGYEQHKTIDEYYKRLGPDVPIHSLLEEIADNQANEHEALKFGNNSHLNAGNADVTPGGANELAYRTNLPLRKAAYHKAIDDMLNNETPSDPSDDFIAILGSAPSTPQAGYPQITIPMGYNATQRRTLNVSVYGGAYDERDLIGIGYVIEQATKLRQRASMVNPSMYRCAKTVPAPPFADRGSCNPDYPTALKLAGGSPTILPFSLETESAKSLQDRMMAGTLSSEMLTKAYLTRIALTNAEGPALQAVRQLNTNALSDAKAMDAERASSGVRGPLHGLPVLIDDTIDARGLPTTGGSIALQKNVASADSALVAKLKAAGAIILGKTNVGEFNGLFDANMPEGYSSLGGQVLMASDTDNSPGGSSAGSTASTAEGLAALTFGLETSPDTAQIIAPAGIAGVVALKPSVGLVPTTGVLGVASSQDALGPITRTVGDAATALSALTGTAYPLSSSLAGKTVGVTSSTTGPYPAVVTALTGAGATTVTKTVPAAPTTPSIVASEFKRDLEGYLAGRPGINTLSGIVNYNAANPVEGLKYQQGQLEAALSPDLSTYASDLATGKAASAAVIDGLLSDVDVMVVPSGDALVGIADRAGYPVLTVPAGYGTAGAGRNPIGVTFVGGMNQEAKLLSAAYAYEQATNVRLAPSWTNPSMFRCVPGSTFYSPHHCHPGDLMGTVPFGPDSFVIAGDVGGTVPATLSLVLGAAPAFGVFTPGVAATYTASTTATVISTAGDATLTVADPTGTNKLVNGAFSLASPLGGLGVVKTYTGPVSNDVATVTFTQAISATEPLRTGPYTKTLTYTLSTTTP